jgi:hypothetical protein
MGWLCCWLLQSDLLRFLQNHSAVIPAESGASAFVGVIVIGLKTVQHRT